MRMRENQFVCYAWPEYEGYLIAALFPGAVMRIGTPEDSVADALTGMPEEGGGTFLFHLDCTITDRFPYVRADLVQSIQLARGRVLNGAVTDISKRNIQRFCRALGLPTTSASPKGPADELVIVKTNFNYGGKREKELTTPQREQLGIWDPGVLVQDALDYRILARGDVAPAMWRDESVVVEMFISNFGGHWYRAYVFLGQMVLCEMASQDRIKKVGSSELLHAWRCVIERGVVVCQVDTGLPLAAASAVAKFAQEVSLDFGTVDILPDETGVPYIIDLNTTPYYGHPVPGLVEHLRADPVTAN